MTTATAEKTYIPAESFVHKGKFCFVDFEFCESEESTINLTSCSYAVGDSPTVNVWLKGSNGAKKKTAKYFKELNRQGYTFVAYGAVAECRSFMALGLDPNYFNWIDLYFEHKQLTHNFNKFEYGCYFDGTAIPKFSVPPSYIPSQNRGKDNTKVKGGYTAAVAVHFEEYIDSVYKTQMRNLILENRDHYTVKERKDIMDYCASDIVWLPRLLHSMTVHLSQAIQQPLHTITKIQRDRGDYAASLAKMESEGFPLWVDAIKNLRRNYETAKISLIEDLNEIYPFYVKKYARISDKIGKYVKSYDAFATFIEESPDIDTKRWPLSDKGKYKSDEKTLDKYEGIPEIKAYKQTNKIMSQLKWFQIPEEGDDDFFDSVGSDDRLRAFLGAFGTQTCLTGDTLVYSKQRGYLRMTEVKKSDLLWDGEDFVKHEGLKYTGLREVIDFNGVRATPDHRFLNKDWEWVEAQSCIDPLVAPSHGQKIESHNRVEFENVSKKNLRRIVKRTARFKSGYLATNVHFSNQDPIKTKDRYTPSSFGILGDILNTPHTYAESKVKWKSMFRRANNACNKIAYVGASVDEKWKNFSSFTEWYEANKHPDNTSPVLDKDFILQGNRVYSPDRCLVVTDRLNRFIVGSVFKSKKGCLPTGVKKVYSMEGLYRVSISLDGTSIDVGLFDSLSLAEEAYRVAKNNIFREVLEEEKKFLTDHTYHILKTFQSGTGCAYFNTCEEVPVYDITNCGPNSRFAVYDNELNGMIAHNSRNAPKAKTFVLAMSAWLRCLVRPNKGEAIVGIDYASQEFIIAAVMSKDPDMMKAYKSGDPYLYFGIKAGGCSEKDGEWWKNEKQKYETTDGYICPDPEKYARISEVRNLFKATTLGLQYGMGALSLAQKLTADCGRLVTEDEARNLIKLHQKTYPKYWRWLDSKEYEYKRNKFLTLKDGWSLMPDNDNMLSVRNFPVQGTGAVIMRRAVHLAHRKGIRILAPLHDALYAIFNEETEADHPRILSECMQQAVEDVLGDIQIRQDIEIHDHDHIWVEGKGKKYYDLLNKYLYHMDTIEDVDTILMETLLGEPQYV